MLDKNSLKMIYEHAVEEYPDECCGVVTGDGKGVSVVHKCRNIQNELHNKDPDRYKRDAKTAYHIDPKEILNIFNDTEKNGLKVIAFYHSHPHHAAYFSQEDRDMAMFRSEEHTSELQSQFHIVCRLLLEKKNQEELACDQLIKNRAQYKGMSRQY